MIYAYDNVDILKSIDNEIDFHIAVTEQKWKEMIYNEDLRFFKHRKNILNELLKYNTVVLRVGSWNSPKLLKDYDKSRKISHSNLMRYICYFEYEMDIIHYLCNDIDYPEDSIDELAIIIKPFFEPIIGVEMQINPFIILKQIILTVFVLFYKHNIGFNSIHFDNIYIKKYNQNKILSYDIGETVFNIKTTHVIKIDEYRNMIMYKDNENINKKYEILNRNIKSILEQFNKTIDLYNIYSEIIDKESSVKMLHKIIENIDNYI